jgi:ABC-2 type transport system ATP-binding protein
MSPPVLHIEGLTKHFGKVKAVNELHHTIPQGTVYGLLGPNGSGKTTTLGMVLGVVNPTAGSYSWYGQGHGHHLRKRLGAILESPCFYHYLSGYQNLRVVAHIKSVPAHRINEVLQRVGLADRAHHAFKTYSLGMKQRLAIAAALLPNPSVLILDEPTNGLDPMGIAEIRTLIIDLAAEGRTIVLASHLLDEVQRVCTHFCVLHRGHKVYEGAVAHLSAYGGVEVAAPDMAALGAALSTMPLVAHYTLRGNAYSVALHPPADAAALNEALHRAGVALNHLSAQAALEKKFIEILRQQPNP